VNANSARRGSCPRGPIQDANAQRGSEVNPENGIAGERALCPFKLEDTKVEQD